MPGQTLILTSTTYVGTTRDLLVGPLAERGLLAGHEVSWPSPPNASTPATTGTARTTSPGSSAGPPESCAAAAAVLAEYAPVHLVRRPGRPR